MPFERGPRLALNVRVLLAGMVGFEPTVHCTKNSCLTTWLHPSSDWPSSRVRRPFQPSFDPKSIRLVRRLLEGSQILRFHALPRSNHPALRPRWRPHRLHRRFHVDRLLLLWEPVE